MPIWPISSVIPIRILSQILHWRPQAKLPRSPRKAPLPFPSLNLLLCDTSPLPQILCQVNSPFSFVLSYSVILLTWVLAYFLPQTVTTTTSPSLSAEERDPLLKKFHLLRPQPRNPLWSQPIDHLKDPRYATTPPIFLYHPCFPFRTFCSQQGPVTTSQDHLNAHAAEPLDLET